MGDMTNPILAKANEAVEGRRGLYGEPATEFERVASMWSELLGVPIRAVDVPVMMVIYKCVRSRVTPKYEDNYVDIAGYAAIAAECVEFGRDDGTG